MNQRIINEATRAVLKALAVVGFGLALAVLYALAGAEWWSL